MRICRFLRREPVFGAQLAISFTDTTCTLRKRCRVVLDEAQQRPRSNSCLHIHMIDAEFRRRK